VLLPIVSSTPALMSKLLIAVTTGLLSGPAMAQVDPKVHKLCSEAKDYKGCVEQHNQNEGNQATSQQQQKMANYIGGMICQIGSYELARMNPSQASLDFKRVTGLDASLYEATITNPDSKEALRNLVLKNLGTNCPRELPERQDQFRLSLDMRGKNFEPTRPERPTEGASVATWQSYCNSQGKTYYERTSGLSWFGIKLSNKKEWQGCLTDAEAAQSGAGGTTYTPVNPRPPVNCYGSGYATGGKSFNTKTTCY
jgi:hypothetical protein